MAASIDLMRLMWAFDLHRRLIVSAMPLVYTEEVPGSIALNRRRGVTFSMISIAFRHDFRS